MTTTTKTDQKITDAAQKIVDTLIADIEANPTGTWTKPWAAALSSSPVNVATGKHYRGSNVFRLGMEAMLAGYSGPEWGTYRQWASLGYQVQKGESSTLGLYAGMSPIKDRKTGEIKTDEHGKEIWRPVRRTFSLFHRDQTDAPAWQAPEVPEVEHDEDLLGIIETLYTVQGIDVTHRGDRACYQPGSDTVTLPEITSFESTEGYATTALHEAGHWTGHSTRLDRLVPGAAFGTPAYAREELTVELAAVLMLGRLGVIDADVEDCEHRANSATYLLSWLKGGSPERILEVMSDAHQVADMLVPEEDRGEVTVDKREPAEASA